MSAFSKLSKAKKAMRAKDAVKSPDAVQIAWIVVSVIGIGPALGVVVVCLVGVVAFMGGSSTSSSLTGADPSASASFFPDGSGDLASALVGGAGDGELAEDKIPRKDLVQPIKEAGKECELISPVVLAAQIEVESQFDTDLVGPNGEEGISQLPPDVFKQYGKDDDENGKVSALDPEDSIFAQARYLCALGDSVQSLLDDKEVEGDRLTLALLAWDIGLQAVEDTGGMAFPDLESYPFRVRTLFEEFETGNPAPVEPAASASNKSTGVSEAQFQQMFPSRSTFYTYAGLTAAMKKFPAFAGTGDDATRSREIAAFLANVNHESGGLVFVEEINQSVWGKYCDSAQPYGCPAGQTAYHGRGPIQLSWNTNYQAAGKALGVDLLNNPDLVKNDATVAWQTALWFWMTSTGAGTQTPHAAITSGAGFGKTIRAINGALECNGGDPGLVQARVTAYQKFSEILGVEPGDKLSC